MVSSMNTSASDVSVRNDLRRWGPESTNSPPLTIEQAEAYTRSLARKHYENFPVVTWMLPQRLHQHFYNVYAFCRWADDLGDEMDSAGDSLKLLKWWREELNACYTGDQRHPVFIALAKTIQCFSIPQQPFTDLISAFEQDQHITDYATFAQLHDYCRRSANPVGRIVLRLCERHTDENVGYSDAICTGLQLANMWQDVARDLEMGRIYLPREDRERFGYSEEKLQARVTDESFLQLMEYQVDRAESFLQAGLPLADCLSGRLKIDIELFARGGLAILREIRRIDYRVWEQRPALSRLNLASMFWRTLFRRSTRWLSR